MNFTGLLFAAAVALLGVSAAMIMFYLARRKPEQQVSSRFEATVASESSQSDSPLLKLLSNTGQGMEKWLQDEEATVPELMNRAGWRDDRKRMLFYTLQIALPLGAISAVVTASVVASKVSVAEMLVYSIGGLALGILAPRYFLRSAATARQGRVRNEVPIFVHMLVMLYDSGLSTRQALGSLVKEGRQVLPELNIEFSSALRQLEAGADLVQVLGDMETDLDVSELSNVLGLLRQIERYGGEARESLLAVLRLLEERRVLGMRERVNHMSGRMTVIMVMFFFPALLLCVAGPAFTAIIHALGSAIS